MLLGNRYVMYLGRKKMFTQTFKKIFYNCNLYKKILKNYIVFNVFTS